MKKLFILPDFNDASTVEDTLQTAIRELGTAVGAACVKASIQPAFRAVSSEPASAG